MQQSKTHNAAIGQPGITHFSMYVADICLAGKRMKQHGAENKKQTPLRRTLAEPEKIM